MVIYFEGRVNQMFWKIACGVRERGVKGNILIQSAITKKAQTGWFKHRNSFSHDSGGWKIEIREPEWLGSAKSSLSCLQTANFLLDVSSCSGEREHGKIQYFMFHLKKSLIPP